MQTHLPRLLLAEDDATIAMHLHGIAVEAGWQPIGPLPTVQAVTEALDAGEIAGALLDFRLRDGTVDTLFPILRTRGIPFVIVTAYDLSDFIVSSGRGPLLVIHKPCNEERLRQALRAFLPV